MWTGPDRTGPDQLAIQIQFWERDFKENHKHHNSQILVQVQAFNY